MNASISFNALAANRYLAMQEQHDKKQKEIKFKAGSVASIELPAAITNLIR